MSVGVESLTIIQKEHKNESQYPLHINVLQCSTFLHTFVQKSLTLTTTYKYEPKMSTKNTLPLNTRPRRATNHPQNIKPLIVLWLCWVPFKQNERTTDHIYMSTPQQLQSITTFSEKSENNMTSKTTTANVGNQFIQSSKKT